MYLETNELSRKELYGICCKIYSEVRKDDPDPDNVLEILEDHGFSLQDIS